MSSAAAVDPGGSIGLPEITVHVEAFEPPVRWIIPHDWTSPPPNPLLQAVRALSLSIMLQVPHFGYATDEDAMSKSLFNIYRQVSANRILSDKAEIVYLLNAALGSLTRELGYTIELVERPVKGDLQPTGVRSSAIVVFYSNSWTQGTAHAGGAHSGACFYPGRLGGVDNLTPVLPGVSLVPMRPQARDRKIVCAAFSKTSLPHDEQPRQPHNVLQRTTRLALPTDADAAETGAIFDMRFSEFELYKLGPVWLAALRRGCVLPRDSFARLWYSFLALREKYTPMPQIRMAVTSGVAHQTELTLPLGEFDAFALAYAPVLLAHTLTSYSRNSSDMFPSSHHSPTPWRTQHWHMWKLLRSVHLIKPRMYDPNRVPLTLVDCSADNGRVLDLATYSWHQPFLQRAVEVQRYLVSLIEESRVRRKETADYHTTMLPNQIYDSIISKARAGNEKVINREGVRKAIVSAGTPAVIRSFLCDVGNRDRVIIPRVCRAADAEYVTGVNLFVVELAKNSITYFYTQATYEYQAEGRVKVLLEDLLRYTGLAGNTSVDVGGLRFTGRRLPELPVKRRQARATLGCLAIKGLIEERKYRNTQRSADILSLTMNDDAQDTYLRAWDFAHVMLKELLCPYGKDTTIVQLVKAYSSSIDPNGDFARLEAMEGFSSRLQKLQDLITGVEDGSQEAILSQTRAELLQQITEGAPDGQLQALRRVDDSVSQLRAYIKSLQRSG